MVPEVKMCSVDQCFYYSDNMCCAHSILVGSEQPICETYMSSGEHTNRCGQSEVGACHVVRCAYNDALLCRACDDIDVGWSDGQAMCTTFSPR